MSDVVTLKCFEPASSLIKNSDCQTVGAVRVIALPVHLPVVKERPGSSIQTTPSGALPAVLTCLRETASSCVLHAI